MDEVGIITIDKQTKNMIYINCFKLYVLEIDDKMNKHPANKLYLFYGISDLDYPTQ
ncbi:MAG: hypothetical protein ACFFHD_10570 [Promethearchaeota archaeon]